MRKIIIILGTLLTLAGAAWAADSGIDMDLMQTIEDLNKSLSSNVALQDVAASKADAQELHQLFTQVQAHYVEKGDAPDAVELSTKSVDLTAAIITAVEAKDFASASESSTALSRTCRACHTFYKKS